MYYLDHAAATPLSAKAKKAFTAYFSDQFFNPSSPYLPAQTVRDAYEAAKDTIAHSIGARGADLIITAGATESINLAFSFRYSTCNRDKCVLISAVEHPAVSETAKKSGSYDTIKVSKHGIIDLADLAAKITPHTQFISIALASSELGSIQPIAKAAELVKAERARRLAAGETTPLYLHCDASQGLGILDIKVARLGVDLLTLNSAKVYGPKGIGALWVGRGVKLEPLIVGGGQESGLRSGTENVPGVIGFAAAIKEAAAHQKTEQKRLLGLKNTLKGILTSADQPIIFLGDPKHQLANFLPLSIPGLDAERLIYKLEKQQVYLSTGAACAANKGQKSQALKAIGITNEQIAGSLRISLGKLNTEKNIQQAGHLILEAINEEQERTSGKTK